MLVLLVCTEIYDVAPGSSEPEPELNLTGASPGSMPAAWERLYVRTDLHSGD